MIWLAVLCVLAGIVGILGALTYWLTKPVTGNQSERWRSSYMTFFHNTETFRMDLQTGDTWKLCTEGPDGHYAWRPVTEGVTPAKQ